MISICVIYCCIVFSLPDISITCIFFCDVRGSICFLALPHLVKQQKQYTNELSCSELVSWPFQCTLQLFARSWPYPNFQIWERSGCVGGLSAAHVWNITVCDFPFFFFFRFFASPTDRHGWPIFTICKSNDAFSRKQVPFGGLDDEFSHLPPFLPRVAMVTKIWEF